MSTSTVQANIHKLTTVQNAFDFKLTRCCLIYLQEYPGSQTAGWGWAAVSWLSQLSVAGNADR